MDMALDKIVPEDLNWLHTDEGPEFVCHRFRVMYRRSYFPFFFFTPMISDSYVMRLWIPECCGR